MSVQTLIAALMPVLIYSMLVWHVRRHDRAIILVLVPGVLWGALVATSLTMQAQETLLANAALLREGAATKAILLSPVLEEVLKGVALLLMLWAARLETALEGALLGAGVGLGFAATENLLSFSTALAQAGLSGWLGAVVTRTALTSVMHASSTAVAGAIVAHWAGRTDFDRWVVGPLLGYVAAVLVHTGFNGGVLAAGASPGVHIAVVLTLGLVLALLVRWALASERHVFGRELLRESAEHGSLSRDEARRVARGLSLEGVGETATRLALLRVRESRCPSPKGSSRRREIVALRGVLASRVVVP